MYRQCFERDQIEEIKNQKEPFPLFAQGDKIVVHVRIREGERERIQKFEGVCIAKRNAELRSSFTVRRVSNGFGIERKFFLYSPLIQKIECLHYGRVRRAKLYYLRTLSSKEARLTEDKRRQRRALAHKNNLKPVVESTVSSSSSL